MCSLKRKFSCIIDGEENTTILNFGNYLVAYFELLEHPIVQNLIDTDPCNSIVDCYHLATVFIYFRRANISIIDYNIKNFFTALYISHEVEEDNDIYKENILKSYFRTQCKRTKEHDIGYFLKDFLNGRLDFLHKMEFKGIVSKRLCDCVLKNLPLWVVGRIRSIQHSGVMGLTDFCCLKCDQYF